LFQGHHEQLTLATKELARGFKQLPANNFFVNGEFINQGTKLLQVSTMLSELGLCIRAERAAWASLS
jgi:hypothetical protein